MALDATSNGRENDQNNQRAGCPLTQFDFVTGNSNAAGCGSAEQDERQAQDANLIDITESGQSQSFRGTNRNLPHGGGFNGTQFSFSK